MPSDPWGGRIGRGLRDASWFQQIHKKAQTLELEGKRMAVEPVCLLEPWPQQVALEFLLMLYGYSGVRDGKQALRNVLEASCRL